jgi:HAE1 family hydrophobic/amphiphilic exporter-1
MEFDSGVDVRQQEIQVRGKIANVKAALPDETSEPEVFRQDPDDTPIIEIAVTGDRTAAEMTTLADDVIARKLRQIPSVGEVDLSGEREPEIKVELHPEALDELKLDATTVIQSIKAMNRNDPAGQIEGGQRVWLLRATSEVRAPAELAQIPVARTAEGLPVTLGDIADVSSGFQEVTRVSRFGDHDGFKPAVLLNVLKQSGENTVAVSDRVRAALVELRKELPGDVAVTITRDNADLVRDNVQDVKESLIIGALLTVFVVLIFLRSLRSTITTGLSLPSSVITTFAVMFAAGFTVNVMTLLALSLAVGILVDDAIVVRENIFRHLGSGNAKDAAVKGAKEVQLAVVATTLVIVAVFVPVGFMGGVSGQFFRQFALTVVFAVLVSLYDAMTMAPMLSAYFANIADPAKEWAQFGPVGRGFDKILMGFEHAFDRVAEAYGRALHWIVRRPVVPLAIAVLALGGAALGFRAVKKSFLPTQFGKVFQVQMQGPLAVPIDRVVEVADEAERRIKAVDGLDNWTISAGIGFTGSASVNMTLRIAEDHARDQTMLGNIRGDVRKALAGIPGYTARVSEPADPLAGSSGRFQPLAVMVAGDDIGLLRDLGREVRDMMSSINGIGDVGNVDDEGLPELQVRTDPLLAGYYGVTAQNVGDALKDWVLGDATNSLRIGDDQVPIRVTLKGGKKMGPNDLIARNLYVRGSTRSDTGVAIASVTHLEPGAGATVINRENRQRIMRIGANLQPGAALGDLVDELQGKLDGLPLPQGYSVRIAGQNEQMAELFGNVVTAIGIGALFVYMILVSLFESFMQPIAVMTAIPLAATGAVAALLLTGTSMDLYAGVGMILLAGIVAKNSILLVDFAMQRVRDHGANARDAILEAAPLRLRPIVMTSVAMIAGMIPVAFGLGASGEARKALGVATIGGVISSTVLTLLVVPSVYLAIDWLTQKAKRRPA